MNLNEPPRRDAGESVIPMINIVFLLLVFFLMTSEIAPPEPFPVSPPHADGAEPAEAPLVLHLDAGGRLGFRDVTGEEAALAALAAEIGGPCPPADCAPPDLVLRADLAVPGERVAALLARLAAAGIGTVRIVTAPR